MPDKRVHVQNEIHRFSVHFNSNIHICTVGRQRGDRWPFEATLVKWPWLGEYLFPDFLSSEMLLDPREQNCLRDPKLVTRGTETSL